METREDRIEAYRKAQPLAELQRKAAKARRLKGKLWTQEELEAAAAWADEIWPFLSPSPTETQP